MTACRFEIVCRLKGCRIEHAVSREVWRRESGMSEAVERTVALCDARGSDFAPLSYALYRRCKRCIALVNAGA